MIECPLCGEGFAALLDDPKEDAYLTGPTYDLPPPRLSHSGLGIAATALGAAGSLLGVVGMALAAATKPGLNPPAVASIALNAVGLLLAGLSFATVGRRRTFSWAGLVLCGWYFALLAVGLFLAFAIGAAVLYLGLKLAHRDRGGKWGVAYCPRCGYRWYPRGHYSSAYCPRCRGSL
jgi:hypothetical protein